MTKKSPKTKTTDSVPAAAPELLFIPLNRLHLDAGVNPREEFDQASIDELAASILQVDLVQPLVVQPHPERRGHYQVIAGERRTRALLQLRGGKKLPASHPVPVVVRADARDDVAAQLEIALIENLHRKDLDPFEEATAFRALREMGRSTAAIAERSGISQRQVQFRLKLLNAVREVRAAHQRGELPVTHVRLLATAPPEHQRAALAEYLEYPEHDRSEDLLRELLTADGFPAAHALFDRKAYQGPTAGEGKELCYLDPEEARRLQLEAVERLRKQRAASDEGYEFVEVQHGHYPTTRRGAGEGGGLVILVHPDYRVTLHEHQHHHPTSRPAEASPAQPVDEMPGETHQPTTTGGVPAPGALEASPAPASVPQTVLRRARNVRNEALQRGIGVAPEVAKRLLALVLLGFSPPAVRLRLERCSNEEAPDAADLAVVWESSFGSLLERLQLNAGRLHERIVNGGASWEEYLDGMDRVRAYEVLSEIGSEELDQLIAVLLAPLVGTWGYQTPPDQDDELAVRVARDITADVTAVWSPNAEDLGLYQKAQLRVIAADLGLNGDTSLTAMKKSELIEAALEAWGEQPDYLPREYRWAGEASV